MLSDANNTGLLGKVIIVSKYAVHSEPNNVKKKKKKNDAVKLSLV